MSPDALGLSFLFGQTGRITVRTQGPSGGLHLTFREHPAGTEPWERLGNTPRKESWAGGGAGGAPVSHGPGFPALWAQDRGSEGCLWPWPRIMVGWGPGAFTGCLLSTDHPDSPVSPALDDTPHKGTQQVGRRLPPHSTRGVSQSTERGGACPRMHSRLGSRGHQTRKCSLRRVSFHPCRSSPRRGGVRSPHRAAVTLRPEEAHGPRAQRT